MDVLRSYGVLDTEPEERFDRIVRLASRLTNTPFALVNLIDDRRQFFKARLGLEHRETPRSVSVCAHALDAAGPFVIEDLSRDDRFKDNPYVSGEPHLRFYAGIPLVVPDGYCVGTLCVMDTRPRTLPDDVLKDLSALAEIVVDELELTRRTNALEAQSWGLEETLTQTQEVLDSLSSGFLAVDADWRVTHMNLAAEHLVLQRRDELIGQNLWDVFPKAIGSDFEQQYRQAMRTRVSRRFEAYFAPLDAWFQARVYPLADGLSIYFDDVSERHAIDRERVQHAHALAAREGAFRALADNTPDLIARYGLDLRVQYVNRAIEEATGIPRERLIGIHAADADRANTRRPGLAETLAEVIETGQIRRVSFVYPNIEGGSRHYDSVFVPERDDQGEIASVLVTSRDMTAHAAAQQALEEAAQKYRALVEQSGQIVYDHNIDTDTIEWSGNTWVITGNTPEELAAMDFEEWARRVHPDDVEETTDLLKTAMRKRTAFSAAYRFRHADGSYRHIEDMGVVILQGQAQEPHMVGVMTDVTERVAHAEATAMSESRYRTLSTLVKTFAFAYRVPDDATLPAVEWVTGSVEDVIGWPAEDLIGRSWGILQDDPTKANRLTSLLSGERRTDDVRVLGKDGRVHWVRLHMWPEVDSQSGRIRHIHGGGIDVTLFKDAEAALIQAKEESDRARVSAEIAKERVEEMARLKDAFLANMSHEIRTPLTGIMGFASLLEQEVTEEGKEFVAYIEAAGQRLSETLTSVLELSQIQSGQVELNPVPLNIGERLRAAAALFVRQASAKGIEMTVEVPGEPLVAALDKPALDRILTNLLSNAIKYSERGTVTLAARDDGEWLDVSVSDTGIGITEDFLPHLFEEFRQESSGLSRQYEGVGLGLTICSRLTQLMGGTIHVQSRKGKGSTFTIRLPLLRAASQPASTPPRTSGLKGQRRRVLVVEDMKETLVLLEMLLSDVHEATFAATPEDALRARGPFDVVLLDINLGREHMSGLELLALLRQTSACEHAHFVAVTAYALPGDQERFLAAGFDRYVAKPFDPLDLLQSIIDD